jgi:broad specificity phosphatase PhoE
VIEIVLVRHASTTWSGMRYCGRSDPPLSAAGRHEAIALAERLVSTLRPGVRLISSPSRRALATAEAIARAIGGMAIERDPRWREADCGVAEGRTFAELSALAPATAALILAGETAIDWPDGETAASLDARVAAAVEDIGLDGRRAVVVTHAGPILHAVALSEERATSALDLVPPATEVCVAVRSGRVDRRPVLPSPT